MGTSDRGNAVQDAFWLACDRLLFEHTNPWELDEALTNWGFKTGPCEMMDHVGLDKVLKRRKGAGSPVLARMVAEGRIGKIGGVGHYRYPGGGGAVIDPLIEDLILEEAYFGKQTRSPMSDDVIVGQLTSFLSDAINGAVEDGADREEMLALVQDRLHFPASKLNRL
jgi:3-hydroxyacyl-CoA dehydrogenase